ncbi:uncharacterized protein LOC129918165 [Episyrphus balteatus]|uniref:uncharacterized protein LOC129918165 n=1 Tax=Episyrphus balteatus TaxID=286459 RepID=UPI0024867B1C|nr:uncharacterized protein LOC129918165 [Episyrphus balteatus]
MKDLKGSTLPVFFGGPEPALIVSKSKNGDTVIGGFVGHIFKYFAKKHNAKLNTSHIDTLFSINEMNTLVLNGTIEILGSQLAVLQEKIDWSSLSYPYILMDWDALAKKHNITLLRSTIDFKHSPDELIELVRNDSVDISAAIVYPDIPPDGWTYPLEYINWCLLLPIEPSIPRYDIFLVVFRLETVIATIVFVVLLSILLEVSKLRAGKQTNLIGFIVNDNCLRGALGQSFTEVRNAPLRIRFIYLQICLLGIIITTSYNSYLQTYVTSPPTIAKINTFDDLLKSGIKIYSYRTEFEDLIKSDQRFAHEWFEMFMFEENFARYVIFRDKMDTKFAYTVNQIKWITIQEQQKIFTKPLFRQPKGMCFFDFFPVNFPIDENSIFMDVINFLILEIQSSGLQKHWQKWSFHELIDSGRIKLEDLSGKKVDFVPMKADHLRLIWIARPITLVGVIGLTEGDGGLIVCSSYGRNTISRIVCHCRN